jgi:hypothetical protein
MWKIIFGAGAKIAWITGSASGVWNRKKNYAHRRNTIAGIARLKP